ncbi:hypothetical protein J3Q64DRAFT_1715094 [Phycomyces blakesleeanus]|uniref:Uncharacterized protein n=1 Tax=Phycomyces blakesleeanus TaxID=4837 RepID=A0ABR3BFX0_PHYBL
MYHSLLLKQEKRKVTWLFKVISLKCFQDTPRYILISLTVDLNLFFFLCSSFFFGATHPHPNNISYFVVCYTYTSLSYLNLALALALDAQ